MIKLIAIDLDGTLFKEDKTVSERNKKALQKAKEKGIKVVICTGRPLKAIDYLLEELHLTDAGDVSVTFNGGLVQKNDTSEILHKKALTLDEVKTIYQVTKNFDLPTDILSDSIVYQLPSSRESWYKKPNPRLTFIEKNLEDLDENTIYNKIVCAFEPNVLDDALSQFPKEFFEQFEISKSRDFLLEIMPKGVTKAFGLEQLGKLFNISKEEMMTIGDEENDLPMIAYAKYGIAMGNAVKSVKKIAYASVSDNEHDGVAEAIEKYAFSV